MTGTGSSADFWAGLIGFVVIGGGAWYLTGLAERRRHERNRAFAVACGWDYLPEDSSLVWRFQSHPFGEGSSQSATDAMRGSYRHREFVLFGYRFVTGSGKDRQVHNYAILAIRVPGRIPMVRFGPEHLGTRILAAFGADDVEVESEEFNRRWFVAAQDQRAAHALLTPRMIERFLAPDLNRKTVSFEPGQVLVASLGKMDLPKTMPPFDMLVDVADLVPAFLAQDFPE